MTNMLAEVGGSGPSVPWEYVIGSILAVIGAMFAGFKNGVAKTQAVKVDEPVPVIPTSKVSTPPSWDAHRAVCDRVSRLEQSFEELRREQASQYKDMMQATNGLESRLGSKLDGIAREIHHRIDEALKPKTTPR